MKKSALAAFAAASAAALILLAASPASAQVVTDTAGHGTVTAAAPSSRTTVVTNQALSPNTISGPHYWMYTNDGNPGGRIDFWPNGDVIELCDIQADGYAPRAQISDYPSPHYFRLIAPDGNGTCTVSRASQGADYDLTEEACVEFEIWLGDGTGTIYSSSRDYAWWLNDNDIKANC